MHSPIELWLQGPAGYISELSFPRSHPLSASSQCAGCSSGQRWLLICLSCPPPAPNLSTLCLSRAVPCLALPQGGLAAMALSAAASYAPKHIRVNCVSPGLTDTPLASRITSSEAALKASTAMHALKRIGRPEEVAAALEFLLHPSNSFITGQNLGVDGGLGSVRAS